MSSSSACLLLSINKFTLQGRKTKCDRNPNGCANCAAKGLPCVTTDRVSGHTVARGELQELRSENQQLQQENDLLRKQLAAYKRTLGGRFQGGTSGNYSQASTPGIVRSLLLVYFDMMLLTSRDRVGWPVPEQNARDHNMVNRQ